MLMLSHHEFLESPEFQAVAARVDLGHFRGDSNLAADSVSRASWETFFRLCHDLRIRPQQVDCLTSVWPFLTGFLAMLSA